MRAAPRAAAGEPLERLRTLARYRVGVLGPFCGLGWMLATVIGIDGEISAADLPRGVLLLAVANIALILLRIVHRRAREEASRLSDHGPGSEVEKLEIQSLSKWSRTAALAFWGQYAVFTSFGILVFDAAPSAG